MPTSQFRQLNEIVEAIVFSKPRSVLDIGVGYAKYGVLTREYLDHRLVPARGDEPHMSRGWY